WGAFKTADMGHMTLQNPPLSGLGHNPSRTIIVKRPYTKASIVESSSRGRSVPYQDGNNNDIEPTQLPQTRELRNPKQIARFDFVTELNALHMEAVCLAWASSLMAFAYDFISQHIRDAIEPPEFDIPKLRFVDAALAIASGGAQKAFLLEEYIENQQGLAFVKYIHNGKAVPI
ncbi:hypothetical protein CALCODRAFT_409275, partial [Calocera cornea HHB12733]